MHYLQVFAQPAYALCQDILRMLVSVPVVQLLHCASAQAGLLLALGRKLCHLPRVHAVVVLNSSLH